MLASSSFFNTYQQTLGLTYARAYDESFNPTSTIPTYITARQLLLASMSSTDVTNGLSVVTAELQTENAYLQACAGIVKNTIQTLNSFYTNTYGTNLRDTFNSLNTSSIISWKNSFKQAYYSAVGNEVVQLLGFCTYYNSTFVIYPAYAPIANIQNVWGIANTSAGDFVTLSTSVSSSVSNFALPGDLIVPSASQTFPSPSVFSLGTCNLVGYANSNTIQLSASISTASYSYLFAFRPLKNAEYLEFRFGTASQTGICATSIGTDLMLNVNLANGISTIVDISSLNSTGRVNIGIYGNSQYQTTAVSSVTIYSGSASALLGTSSLEIWSRGTY